MSLIQPDPGCSTSPSKDARAYFWRLFFTVDVEKVCMISRIANRISLEYPLYLAPSSRYIMVEPALPIQGSSIPLTGASRLGETACSIIHISYPLGNPPEPCCL